MFSDDLKAKLKENHMSQKELASYLNTNQANVSKWVNGKVNPRSREFNMICDLFELSRERYTAERNGLPPVEFTPKPYVDPEVKKKVDLSENPYKPKKKEEPPLEYPQRCDLVLKQLEEEHKKFVAKFEKMQDEMINLRFDVCEKDKKIDELEQKITYLRGMVDGAFTEKPELENKSWWKRLWS